jgi:hypothetical protein
MKKLVVITAIVMIMIAPASARMAQAGDPPILLTRRPGGSRKARSLFAVWPESGPGRDTATRSIRHIRSAGEPASAYRFSMVVGRGGRCGVPTFRAFVTRCSQSPRRPRRWVVLPHRGSRGEARRNISARCQAPFSLDRGRRIACFDSGIGATLRRSWMRRVRPCH